METSAPDSAPVYPQAPTGLRRPALIAGGLTLVVAVVSILVGHPLFAVFFLLGIAAILVNALLVKRAVDAVTAELNPPAKLLLLSTPPCDWVPSRRSRCWRRFWSNPTGWARCSDSPSARWSWC